MLRRFLAVMMLLGILGTIAGCNTMRGFGQDLERGNFFTLCNRTGDTPCCKESWRH